MTCRPGIAATILVAFVATTAVPGSGVVAHRHGGGDHEHVHGFLVDDHHHDHVHRRHPHRLHGHAHLPRVARDDHDPLAHVHVVSPFQSATAPAPPTIVATTLVAADVLRAPTAPIARTVDTVRSRGPPPRPLV